MQITTASEARQRDANAIASGIDSWSLMLTAGSAAADVILAVYADELHNGVAVFAGTGNNGGDAYVVAARLIQAGHSVLVKAVGEPATTDAVRAEAYYQSALAKRARANPNASDTDSIAIESCAVIVDGILGTGTTGPLRERERSACQLVNTLRAHAAVIALDVPTGVDATTGEIAMDAVVAECTIAFGTMKRAHVLQRGQVGRILLVDIGLAAFATADDDAWSLANEAMICDALPDIEWNAYKGTRGRIAIVGGAEGMAGAIVLSARAALRAGAGLVYTHTSPVSLSALQIAVPQVVARAWRQIPDGVRALAIGPGLGRDNQSRRALNRMLDATATTPTVLDADALTLLATHVAGHDDDLDEELSDVSRAQQTVARLRQLTTTRAVVCTPHVGEFARLIDHKVADTIEGRVAQAKQFAKDTGAIVLLKGTPTVVVSTEIAPIVVPRGTAALATGGSGDLLTGVIVSLLGQGASALQAAVVAAWAHGRAAEIATDKAGTVRGITLDEVLHALVDVWRELESLKADSQSSWATAAGDSAGSLPRLLAALPAI